MHRREALHRAEQIADTFQKALSRRWSYSPSVIGWTKTDVGPLATPQIVDDIEKQVAASADGADRHPESAPADAEETFGPMASLFRVRDVDEAIPLANPTTFRLGASVWTRDAGETERFTAGIASGQLFVNARVASDPRLPFGGVKHSDFGRETRQLTASASS